MKVKVKLLRKVWEFIKEELEFIASKTNSKIDDIVIEIMDKIIETLLEDIEQKKTQGGIKYGKD